MDIKNLKGIGDKTAALFNKLNIYDTKDLLTYFPVDYDFYDHPVFIDKLESGKVSAIKVYITSSPALRRVRNLSILSFNVSDGHGEMNIIYFNAPYLKNSIKKGEECIFRGKAIPRGNRLIFTNPRKYKTDEYEFLAGKDIPIYHTTKGLSSQTISKSIKKAYETELTIGVTKERSPLYDILPDDILNKRGLMPYYEAIAGIHFPIDKDTLIKARNRLAYQEFYEYLLNLKHMGLNRPLNNFKMIETADTVRLIEHLPYRLTKDQVNVWEDIKADMTGDHCMLRLLQGDVGSGKTIIAILSLLMCAANGHQGALMAPTEVLAMQHFESVKKLTEDYSLPFKPVLLTGQIKGKARTEALNSIKSGECNLIIGTHALFQTAVEYNDLALVITDEQHRFGVLQREALANKSDMPHIIIMSATPIPRTLALIIYGEICISTIHTMPEGRLPIKNCVVDTSYRPTAYKFLINEIKQGRQVYIICPQIEAGELVGVENVTDYSTSLSEYLPENIRIGVLHGQMTPQAKERVMEQFANGNIDILVSTTVVEVGVNVPNATVMYIENAERFGLAQLHQLRGRVGRSDMQSYCIFMSSDASDKAKERLNILVNSNDGFEIANADMKLRGPGDIFGIRQSGDVIFKIGDIYQDAELIMWAKEDID